MKNILLLNGENVQAVCMAHAFRKLGHCVTALCSTKMSSGYMTRYLNRKFKCPDLHLQSEAFSVFFHKHLANNRYDIIIPMGDESASFLSKHKNHIESQYSTICAIPEYDVFQVANDKHLLMELCEKNNICHPRTRTIQVSNIQEAIEYVGFPAMIKPNISAGAKGIVKVENANEVKKKLPNITHEFGECTLQQYIEQPDYYYNVMLYRNRNGKTVASTIIKIKRFFPLKGGSSCYSETIEQPYLIEQCEKCLDKLNWHGFADFDILEDKKSGELKIIEINPRVPSSLKASFAAGVNFAEIYISDYLDKSDKILNYKYRSGMQVRWFGLDVMWFLMSSERFSFKPSWFKFFGKNIYYHDGSFRDPMPMIAGCLAGVIKYLNPSFRKAKLNK